MVKHKMIKKYHANNRHKKVAIAIVMPDKVDFQDLKVLLTFKRTFRANKRVSLSGRHRNPKCVCV